ncbi:VOC family protein [Qaidamihabitans albus]|uniref:VOC family protein n=1 Tax=Qaidamihabitans albus TaxID=2795733 RepID=UPI0018F1775B|nr:VOC family protein [Qaidamihabitans albus]
MAIRGVSKVIIGVRDQDRASRFWSGTLGFDVTTDASYGDEGNRWVEVASPDGATALILSADPGDLSRFPERDGLPTVNFFLYADDIERTYEELSVKGVEFPAPPTKQPWGWWAMFLDPEGNRYALQPRDS